MMTGNCLGWVVYGYYTRDPFVVAGNIPGLILSIWLNTGAAKLQYLDLSHKKETSRREQWDASAPEDDGELQADSTPLFTLPSDEYLVMVPQERALLRLLAAWAMVLVWAGWFSATDPAVTVGLVVNVNLVFFYGAPLQTMQTVLREKNSNSIHFPTMVMSWFNTSFWSAYGLARHDPVIILPNVIGLTLGIVQGFLWLAFPTNPSNHESVPLTVSPQEDEGQRTIPGEAVRPVNEVV